MTGMKETKKGMKGWVNPIRADGSVSMYSQEGRLAPHPP